MDGVINMHNCDGEQGQAVTQNVSWGVIISTRSLVLQRVARVHAGNYGCAAANDRGENQSDFVPLRIHCKYRMEIFLYYHNIFYSYEGYTPS